MSRSSGSRRSFAKSWTERALGAALLGLLLIGQPAVATEPPAVDPELKRLLQEAVRETDGFEDRYDAEVWLHDMSRRLERWVKDPRERIEILKTVHYEARRAGLEPELVLAVIEVESAFDRFAISVSGARGLMQVMPFWLDEIQLSDKNLFRIRTNLRMGTTILRYYLDMEKGDLGPALARYNGSYRHYNGYAAKVVRALQRHWFKQ